ncbi:MAG: hypothetical protein EA374_06370 [Acholeplasmatales bacterium]|nr:MAG: hypothetical protein EA374_06370 [Acholeplasmatales bacterium]
MKKAYRWTDVVFIGGLWGILEATLGYGLQFLPAWFSGSVMFPIGAAILMMAYRRHGSSRMLVYIGLVAATIKAVNLFMPGLPPVRTYNPMIAIMLQTSLVAVVLPRLQKQPIVESALAIVGVSIGWRILFMLNNSLNVALTDNTIFYVMNVDNLIGFALLLGLVGAVFAILLFEGARRMDVSRLKAMRFHPTAALGMVAIAVLLTWFL